MSDWISVKDRIPEVGESGRSDVVLVYGKNGFIGPRRYYPSHSGFGQIEGTHWMPMPPPPKEQP